MKKMDGIRRATSSDAPAIATIYNHFIEHTIVTFEEQRVTSEEMAGRMERVLASHDWLVLEQEGKLAGYAYATRFRERAAYRFTTESTIYLSPAFLGRGLGAALYRALLERIFELGYRHAIGAISLPNDASIALHERLGFVKVAHYPRVGKKFGQWIDVAAWQLENPSFDDARTPRP
jgi:L-amino acid N-acyltransferase YncA